MTGLTSYAAGATLMWITGRASTPDVANSLIGLFTVVGNDDGTGFVEVSGNSYARAATSATSWGAPAGIKPVIISNSRSISFPVSSGSWGTIAGFGLFDAFGNMMWFDYLGAFQWNPFTAAVGPTGIINSPSHGFAFGDRIVMTAEYGGRMPQAATSVTGVLTIDNVTADTFTIGTSITASGSGMLRKVLPMSVGLNQAVTFNPDALVLQLS